MNISRPYIPLLFSLGVFLSACDQDENRISTQRTDKSFLSTAIPESLRSLDASELNVIVSVNNGEFYNAGDTLNQGNWVVPIDIQADQTYDVTVRWYFRSYLVMEEYASIFANPEQPDIEFNSEHFVTSGYPRFDSDCDGVSNYLESINGANIGPAVETPDINCTNVSLEPTNDDAVHLVTNDWAFDSVQGVVNRFEQSIKIGRQNRDREAAFFTALRGERLDEGGYAERQQIRFINNIGGQKVVQFNHRNAIAGQASEAPLSTCITNNDFLVCQIQYDWKENHWYDLLMSETSPGFWQAWITDTVTQESVLIASIESEQGIVWERAVSGMYFASFHDAASCKQGFPRIAVQYTGILLNGSGMHESNNQVHGDCLKIGGGWSYGKRERNNRFEYSLVIGND